jgi:hypothetical protein
MTALEYSNHPDKRSSEAAPISGKKYIAYLAKGGPANESRWELAHPGLLEKLESGECVVCEWCRFVKLPDKDCPICKDLYAIFTRPLVGEAYAWLESYENYAPLKAVNLAAEDLRAEHRSYAIAFFETIFDNAERAQLICCVAMLTGLMTFEHEQQE